MAEEASKKEWQDQGDWQAAFARADRTVDPTERVSALQEGNRNKEALSLRKHHILPNFSVLRRVFAPQDGIFLLFWTEKKFFPCFFRFFAEIICNIGTDVLYFLGDKNLQN